MKHDGGMGHLWLNGWGSYDKLSYCFWGGFWWKGGDRSGRVEGIC